MRVSHRMVSFSELLQHSNYHPDSDLVFLLRRFSLLTRWSFIKPWWDCDLLCWSRTSWRVQVWVPIKVVFSTIFVCVRSALVPRTDITLKKKKKKKKKRQEKKTFKFPFSHCSKREFNILHVYFVLFQENVILGSDYPFPLGEHHPGKLIEDVYKDDLELRVREQRCFFWPLIRRRRRSCINSLLFWSINFATMVTWRHTCPLFKHWYRLMITFAKTNFGYIEVLFHTLCCNWGRKYRSIYQGLRCIEFRYIEFPLYEREREIAPTPLPRFWLLLIPIPLSPALSFIACFAI